jgi:hypothetical protein
VVPRGVHGTEEASATAEIHNGADDNASGTSAVIELARLFRDSAAPKRGVLLIALRIVLGTFAGHRTMARLLLIEGFGAGAVFRKEMQRLHVRFADLIAGYLDEAVATGVIEPIDTHLAGRAWFGALHEVVMDWLTADAPVPLEDAYPTLRVILLRSVGVPDDVIAARAEA